MQSQEIYKFQAFMAAIRHDEIDYVEQTLLEYDSVTQYLIACETAPESHQETEGQHMHFLVRISDKHYKNFADRVFKRKYGLRGRAEKDKPRQYGKLREIHDMERMGAYTCKENNLRTNLTSKTIERWLKASFEQKEAEKWREKVFEALDEFKNFDPTESIDEILHPTKPSASLIKMEIIQIYKDHEMYKLNKNTITGLSLGYCMSRNYPNKYISDYFL